MPKTKKITVNGAVGTVSDTDLEGHAHAVVGKSIYSLRKNETSGMAIFQADKDTLDQTHPTLSLIHI